MQAYVRRKEIHTHFDVQTVKKNTAGIGGLVPTVSNEATADGLGEGGGGGVGLFVRIESVCDCFVIFLSYTGKKFTFIAIGKARQLRIHRHFVNKLLMAFSVAF